MKVLGSLGYGGSTHLHSALALHVSFISLSQSFIFYNNMGRMSGVFLTFSRWFYRVVEHGGRGHGSSEFHPVGHKHELFEITCLTSELRTVRALNQQDLHQVHPHTIRSKLTMRHPVGVWGIGWCW